MNPSDPITGQLVAESAKSLVKSAEQFITAAFGHAGEDLGTILGTAFHRRLKNLLDVGNKAHFTLLNIGLEPAPVPLKIIHKMIEGASLEENPGLQDKWANLMANAADPRRKYDISPLFQTILSELSPRDAIFLDALHEAWKNAELSSSAWRFSLGKLIDIFKGAGLAHEDWHPFSRIPALGEFDAVDMENAKVSEEFELSMDVLTRTAILRPEAENLPIELWGGIGEVPAGGNELRVFTITNYAYTSFGQRFMRACQLPPANIK
jgi:Abortive infection alpha